MSGLKPAHDRDDVQCVNSCPACALPNLRSAERCAYCEEQLLDAAPVLLRLVHAGGAFRLVGGGRTYFTAEPCGDLWTLQGQGADIAPLALVSLREPGSLEVVFLDEAINLVASVRMDTGRTGSTVLADATDTTAAVVRPDGHGGFHAMDAEGRVLFFAGRVTPTGPLDLLLTEVGASRPLVVLFGLLVALDLEHRRPAQRADGSVEGA